MSRLHITPWQMCEIPSFLLIYSFLTSSAESFYHSTDKDLENIHKGNLIIGSSLKKSAQISALEAFFPPHHTAPAPPHYQEQKRQCTATWHSKHNTLTQSGLQQPAHGLPFRLPCQETKQIERRKSRCTRMYVM